MFLAGVVGGLGMFKTSEKTLTSPAAAVAAAAGGGDLDLGLSSEVVVPKLDATAINSLLTAFLQGSCPPLSVLKICFLFYPELCAAVSTSRQERRMKKRTSF